MKFLSTPGKVFFGAVALFALQTPGYSFDLMHLIGKLHPPKQVPHHSTAAKSGDTPALPVSDGDFKNCQNVFFNGKSPVVSDSAALRVRSLCFSGYATLYSAAHKIPVYSAEVLNKDKLSASNHQSRTDIFFEDARLPSSDRATLHDYVGSGFDRGHNFPAGDSSTPETMAQSFSLANMMPEAPEHNQKLWSGYESATRKYAKRARGDVYVITGSIVEPSNCTIENALSGNLPRRYDMKKCTIGNGVSVPSYIYKVVFDPSINKAWGYWTMNINSQQAGPPVSYAEIVRRTGIDFFPSALIR